MEVVIPPPSTIELKAVRSYRIDAIDLLRGLVMIIMALDHSRDFFHIAANTDDPLNLATTTPFLFFTRFITHFCAPVFVFLAGTSAYFQSFRKSKKELSKFLIQRGLWLLFVEIVIITFAFTYDVGFSFIGLQTIWSIGISMILLGLAIFLPFNAILTIGLLIIFGHNALDFYEKGKDPATLGWFYNVVHHPYFYNIGNNHFVGLLYPFLPWTGLMLVGYCFGKIYKRFEGTERTKVLLYLGIGAILLFIVLRAINIYGDPDPWGKQKDATYTFLSFLNVHKYPPSLLYMAITIGPALIFLALAGETKTRIGRMITVYGRVPFFFYILHFYLIHTISALLFLSRGHTVAEGLRGVPNFPFKFVVPGEGYSLAVTYLLWALVIVLLYPLCKWFSDYKKTHTQWWLSYL